MIIITGASRGIGKFLLEKYISEKNEKVIGIYNSTQPLPQYEKYYIKLDLLNFNSVSEWIKSMKEEFTDLILLNCAGFNLIREILPIMREKKYGRIINFSSIVAQTSIPGTSSYAASKAGLWGMSRAIAAENSTKGITINNLNLGYYDIGMITEVPEKFQSILKEKIPTGNFGNPENIYNAVRFLITSDYVNGSSIDMNGGLH